MKKFLYITSDDTFAIYQGKADDFAEDAVEGEFLVREILRDEELPVMSSVSKWNIDANQNITVDIALTRSEKEDSIRDQRNSMLFRSAEVFDEWYTKSNLDATNPEVIKVLADKVTLRDMMEGAGIELGLALTVQEIEDYDAFSNLTLNFNYN